MVMTVGNKRLAFDVSFRPDIDHERAGAPLVTGLCILMYPEHMPARNVVGLVPGDIQYHVDFADLVLEYVNSPVTVDGERLLVADELDRLARLVRAKAECGSVNEDW